jgi:hypothetical protein
MLDGIVPRKTQDKVAERDSSLRRILITRRFRVVTKEFIAKAPYARNLASSRALWLVPGGGVEPPRAEARRILSGRPGFCKSWPFSIFYYLHFSLPRDWCSSKGSRAAWLCTLYAHLRPAHRPEFYAATCIHNVFSEVPGSTPFHQVSPGRLFNHVFVFSWPAVANSLDGAY